MEEREGEARGKGWLLHAWRGHITETTALFTHAFGDTVRVPGASLRGRAEDQAFQLLHHLLLGRAGARMLGRETAGGGLAESRDRRRVGPVA